LIPPKKKNCMRSNYFSLVDGPRLMHVKKPTSEWGRAGPLGVREIHDKCGKTLWKKKLFPFSRASSISQSSSRCWLLRHPDTTRTRTERGSSTRAPAAPPLVLVLSSGDRTRSHRSAAGEALFSKRALSPSLSGPHRRCSLVLVATRSCSPFSPRLGLATLWARIWVSWAKIGQKIVSFCGSFPPWEQGIHALGCS